MGFSSLYCNDSAKTNIGGGREIIGSRPLIMLQECCILDTDKYNIILW